MFHTNFYFADNLLHDVQQNSSQTKPAATVSRPKKPIKKPSFTVLGPRQARPRSAPPPAKKLLQKPVHPPFLAYGYRDREREVGAKKTHNIRASAEVRAQLFPNRGMLLFISFSSFTLTLLLYANL